jgi:hypothetical protein
MQLYSCTYQCFRPACGHVLVHLVFSAVCEHVDLTFSRLRDHGLFSETTRIDGKLCHHAECKSSVGAVALVLHPSYQYSAYGSYEVSRHIRLLDVGATTSVPLADIRVALEGHAPYFCPHLSTSSPALFRVLMECVQWRHWVSGIKRKDFSDGYTIDFTHP